VVSVYGLRTVPMGSILNMDASESQDATGAIVAGSRA